MSNAQTYPFNLQISIVVANIMFVPSNQTLTFQFLAWTAPIQIGVCLIILIFQVSAIHTLLH
jgi:hypothetical protein